MGVARAAHYLGAGSRNAGRCCALDFSCQLHLLLEEAGDPLTSLRLGLLLFLQGEGMFGIASQALDGLHMCRVQVCSLPDLDAT
eukprot:Skav227926  [mRNA]  locus=scaffold146:232247:235328:- [translate_table: standard]